jgi:hypothetical protein
MNFSCWRTDGALSDQSKFVRHALKHIPCSIRGVLHIRSPIRRNHEVSVERQITQRQE